MRSLASRRMLAVTHAVGQVALALAALPAVAGEPRPAGKIRSLLDLSPNDLIRTLPELKGLEPAPDQTGLPTLLQKVGANVEKIFFRDFPNTASLEDVHQERTRSDGGGEDTLNRKFRYLLLAQPEGETLGLREYRTDTRGRLLENGGAEPGFLLTSGFASMSVHFDPLLQPVSDFRLLGRLALEGRETLVVAFAQRPGTGHAMGRFESGGASVAFLVQGVAWIDPTNYQIVRLRTDALAPSAAAHLEKLTTEIRYGEVSFKQAEVKLWLPLQVVVTVRSQGQLFRNRHSYHDFELFSVQVGSKSPSSGPSRRPQNSN